MPRYAAFLRGINVGGRRLAGEELRACFTAMGFVDVATFRNSGNVAFSAEAGTAEAIAARAEMALLGSLGYAVPAFIRTDAQVRAMARQRPFTADLVRGSGGKLQVVMLNTTPSGAARRSVLALATDADRLEVRASELYWLPSGGIRDSALDLKAVEAVVGSTTMRTKGTVDLMAAKLFLEP